MGRAGRRRSNRRRPAECGGDVRAGRMKPCRRLDPDVRRRQYAAGGGAGAADAVAARRAHAGRGPSGRPRSASWAPGGRCRRWGPLVGVAAVVLAMLAPRAMVGLTALAVLFVRPLEHLVPIPQIGYLDEGLVVLCVATMPLRRVIARRPLRNFPGQWWFALFLVCGLLSALVLHVPIGIFLTGAFVISKGLLFGVGRRPARLDRAASGARGADRRGRDPRRPRRDRGEPRRPERVGGGARERHQRRGAPLLPPVAHRPVHPPHRPRPVHVAVVRRRHRLAYDGAQRPFTLVLLGASVLGAIGTARRTAAGSIVGGLAVVQRKVRSTMVLVALLACLPVAVVLLAGPLTPSWRATYQDYLGNGTPEARTVLTSTRSPSRPPTSPGAPASAGSAPRSPPRTTARSTSPAATLRSGGSGARGGRPVPHRHRVARDHRRGGLLRRAGVRAGAGRASTGQACASGGRTGAARSAGRA